MKPMIQSFLLYLLMFFLLAINIEIVSVFPFFIYFVYIIIIMVVFYINKDIFWGKKIILGVLSGTVLIGCVFFLEMVTGWITIDGFNFNLNLLLISFSLQVLVAIGEEISFRGYILTKLIEDIGIHKGIILSSCMFSAIHIPSILHYNLDISRGIIAFIVIGMIGAILAVLYLNYGLISAIGCHFAWNFLQYNIFTLSKTQYGVMEINNIKPNFLTGGSFGPEAGIVAFSVILLALVIFVNKYSKSLN